MLTIINDVDEWVHKCIYNCEHRMKDSASNKKVFTTFLITKLWANIGLPIKVHGSSEDSFLHAFYHMECRSLHLHKLNTDNYNLKTGLSS